MYSSILGKVYFTSRLVIPLTTYLVSWQNRGKGIFYLLARCTLLVGVILEVS
jgi:hypothetical protein